MNPLYVFVHPHSYFLLILLSSAAYQDLYDTYLDKSTLEIKALQDQCGCSFKRFVPSIHPSDFQHTISSVDSVWFHCFVICLWLKVQTRPSLLCFHLLHDFSCSNVLFVSRACWTPMHKSEQHSIRNLKHWGQAIYYIHSSYDSWKLHKWPKPPRIPQSWILDHSTRHAEGQSLAEPYTTVADSQTWQNFWLNYVARQKLPSCLKNAL